MVEKRKEKKGEENSEKREEQRKEESREQRRVENREQRRVENRGEQRIENRGEQRVENTAQDVIRQRKVRSNPIRKLLEILHTLKSNDVVVLSDAVPNILFLFKESSKG